MNREAILSMERFAEQMRLADLHSPETNILWEHVAAIWQHLAEENNQ